MTTLKDLLTPERIEDSVIKSPYLNYSYATSHITKTDINQLQEQVEKSRLFQKLDDLLSGKPVNNSENRAVLHHQLRSDTQKTPYYAERLKVKAFAAKAHQDDLYDHVVQIGIGGSFLGPLALDTALERWAFHQNKKPKIHGFFVSNIDPDETLYLLSKLNIKRTLFIVASKSGGTQETLENFNLVRKFALKAGLSEPAFKSQCVSITTQNSPLDDKSTFIETFYIDTAIGGRFSSTSPIGGLFWSLRFGFDVYESILEGALSIDKTLKIQNPLQNICLASALISRWEQNTYQTQSKAIVPYSSALAHFPKFLQQLICESLGKSVDQNNRPLKTLASPSVFGDIGTNAQHSFFQMCHQGKVVIPIQFIGFSEPLSSEKHIQTHLNTNLISQICALAFGEDHSDKNKAFPGNRPSTLLWSKSLSPQALGALISYYENGVMFESFLLNMNAFDQEGVQLGKKLATTFGTDSDHCYKSQFSAYKKLLS